MPINLKVLLPFKIFVDKKGVKRIVAQTLEGSFGLLPHRLDCAAALAPGILTYETEEEGEVYLAVDQGVLVKAGKDVLVSVRNAIGGTDLDKLYVTTIEKNHIGGPTEAEEGAGDVFVIEGLGARGMPEPRYAG